MRKRGFPANGTPSQKLRYLVHYATLAPSSHNSQPWLFLVSDDELSLLADRSRALPVVDPTDRELTMSCGASLHHLRVAMRRFGMTPELLLFPDAASPDVLARVRIGARVEPTCEDRELFRAIRKRHTNRHRFEERVVPGDVVATLEHAARLESAWLVPLDAAAREVAASLVMEGDRAQASDPRHRRELASWIHPNRTASRDGMPGSAIGLPDLMSYVGPFYLRTFDWGDRQAAQDWQLALGSPVLAVLGTARDDARGWVEAGQALSHVLLAAAARGLSASFLNQPIELPDLRLRMAVLIEGRGHPQALLRMGYGPPAEPTPRRSCADVLVS
ncbi:MAG: nitroreductase family protein [Acidobacteriota bacterium]